MKDKIVIGLLVVILLVTVMDSFPKTTSFLGGSGCNSGNCTDYDAVNTSAGYYVDDSQVIDGSGNFVSSISTTDAASVGAFTQGGGVTSTSTRDAAVTLVASDFDTENVVKITSASTSVTVTLPATSTLTSLVPTAGDTREIWIYNASTSASANITLAAGTGLKFKNAASSTVLLIGDTDGLNNFRVTFQRITTGGDILVDLMKYQD